MYEKDIYEVFEGQSDKMSSAVFDGKYFKKKFDLYVKKSMFTFAWSFPMDIVFLCFMLYAFFVKDGMKGLNKMFLFFVIVGIIVFIFIFIMRISYFVDFLNKKKILSKLQGLENSKCYSAECIRVNEARMPQDRNKRKGKFDIFNNNYGFCDLNEDIEYSAQTNVKKNIALHVELGDIVTVAFTNDGYCLVF